MREPFGEVLDRTALALARAGRRAEALQDGVGAGAAAGADLQALDLLTQELQALAAYVQALAQSCPAHWRMEAGTIAAGLPLAELAARLRADAPEPAADVQAGELQLF